MQKGGPVQRDVGLKEPAPQKTGAQIQAEKEAVRRQMRTALKALSPGERTLLDRELTRNVLSFPELSDADIVYAYASLPWEPGTWDILRFFLKQGTRVALPRVEKDGMAFYEIRSLSDLTEGAMRLMEPAMQTIRGPGPRMLPCWFREWPLQKTEAVWERAEDSTISFLQPSQVIRPLPWPMNFSWFPIWLLTSTTDGWGISLQKSAA